LLPLSNVRAFHAAANQLLQEARQIIDQIKPLQEIGMRFSRIDGAMGAGLLDSIPGGSRSQRG
jgi:hypothetical protein